MRHTRSRPLSLALLGGLFVLFVTGCGGTGELSGKVSYKGKQLKGGYVSFVPEGGGSSFSSVIDESGSYSVPNMRSGTYKVCVDTESLKPASSSQSSGPAGAPKTRSGGGPKIQAAPGAAMPDEKDKNYKAPVGKALPETGYTPGGAPGDMKKANSEKYVAIPSEFAKAETTKLTYTFSGGSQTYNVEIN